MRKNIIRSFSLLFISSFLMGISIKNINSNNPSPLLASDPTSGAIYYTDADKYYQGIDESLVGEDLMNALCKLTSSGFVNQSYGDLVDLYPLSDKNEDNKIVMLYTGTPLSYSSGSMPSKTNKEHVWPQSWYGPVTGTGSGGPGADGHNVWICDSQLNNVRSSYSFGEMEQDLSKRVYERGSSGSYGQGGGGNLDYANYAYLDYMVTNNDESYPEGVTYLDAYCYTNKNNIFYPRRGSRGMVARTLMYVATRYRLNNNYTVELVDRQVTEKTGKLGKLSTLLKWHYQEPPTEYERKRNDAVSAYWHHNRNPFVDHPEYAEKIYYYLNEPGSNAPSSEVKRVIEEYSNSKVLTSLTYEGTLAKTSYYEGDNFDPTGLTFKAHYDDDSVVDITSKVTFSPNPLTLNTVSVTANYQNKTVIIDGISVIKRESGGSSSSSSEDIGDTSSSSSSSSSSEESSSNNEQEENKPSRGCNASIAGSSIFLFMVSLTGLGIVIKKKKEK